MYTKEQVDEVLFQVEQEFEKALGSIVKNEEELELEENLVSEIEKEEIVAKSEEIEEESEEDDFETIEDLYASMNKNEQEAHYKALKSALFEQQQEVEQVIESQEEEVITKSEEIEAEESITKSENEELKTKNEELQKSLNTMNELIEKLFEKGKKAPKRKSITESYDVIAKSEEQEEEGLDLSKLSKKEITEKLKNINYSGLSKSDRSAINNFYLENGSVDSIKHLIME